MARLVPDVHGVACRVKASRGWPGLATVVRHILCLYECTALILLRRRRSPTLSTAVRANAMRHKATVFEQIVQQFPWHRFDHHVRRHGADDDQRGFTSRT